MVGSNQYLQKDFSLVDQLKRASISVTANIAEGYQRTPKHNKYFLTIASGSTNEMVALLEVVSLIYQIDTNNLQDKYQLLGKQINAFSKTLRTDN